MDKQQKQLHHHNIPLSMLADSCSYLSAVLITDQKGLATSQTWYRPHDTKTHRVCYHCVGDMLGHWYSTQAAFRIWLWNNWRNLRSLLLSHRPNTHVQHHLQHIPPHTDTWARHLGVSPGQSSISFRLYSCGMNVWRDDGIPTMSFGTFWYLVHYPVEFMALSLSRFLWQWWLQKKMDMIRNKRQLMKLTLSTSSFTTPCFRLGRILQCFEPENEGFLAAGFDAFVVLISRMSVPFGLICLGMRIFGMMLWFCVLKDWEATGEFGMELSGDCIVDGNTTVHAWGRFGERRSLMVEDNSGLKGGNFWMSDPESWDAEGAIALWWVT